MSKYNPNSIKNLWKNEPEILVFILITFPIWLTVLAGKVVFSVKIED